MEVNIIANIQRTPIPIQEGIPFTVNIQLAEDGLLKQGATNFDDLKQLVGLARTIDRSSSGHVTTEDCIKKMKEQILEAVKTGYPIPALINHDVDQIYGGLTGVKQTVDTEFWPISELHTDSGNVIADAPMAKIRNWVKNKVRLGQSISGLMTKAKFCEDLDNDDWWIEIDEINLKEISVTPLPAQEETEGTLTMQSCKDGFCNQIVRQIKPVLEEKYPMISEAIERRKGIKDGKISEENNMADKIEIEETEWKTVKQGLEFLTQRAMQEDKDKEALRLKQEQDALIASKINEVKESIEESYKEKENKLVEDVVKQTVASMTGQIFNQNIGQIGQPSAQPVGTPQVVTPQPAQPIVQTNPMENMFPGMQIAQPIQESAVQPGAVLTDKQIEEGLRESIGRPAAAGGKIVKPYAVSEFMPIHEQISKRIPMG